MRELECATKVLGVTRNASHGVERTRADRQRRDLPKGVAAPAAIVGERGRPGGLEPNRCRRNLPIQQRSPNQNCRARVLARRVLRASYVSGTAEDHLPRPAPVWAPAGRIYVQYSWELRHAQFQPERTCGLGQSGLRSPGFHHRTRLTLTNRGEHRCLASPETLGTADRPEQKQP